MTNLLPGVWSSRLELKLRNRRAETGLVGWAEPWAAFGRALGLPDERPALRVAWRALLANQAHDSIGGCSTDRVHRRMKARYDEAEELADETTRECCRAWRASVPGAPSPGRTRWTLPCSTRHRTRGPTWFAFPWRAIRSSAIEEGQLAVHPLTLCEPAGQRGDRRRRLGSSSRG